MKLVNKVCEQLGISHHQLARLLASDRSVISRSVKGERQLNATTALGLAQLQATVEKLPSQSIHRNQMSTSEREDWQARIKELEFQLLALRRRTAAKKKKVEANLLLLQVMDAFVTNPNGSSEKQLRYAADLKANALEKLKLHSPAKLARMEIRIKLLQQELEWMQEALRGFEA